MQLSHILPESRPLGKQITFRLFHSQTATARRRPCAARAIPTTSCRQTTRKTHTHTHSHTHTPAPPPPPQSRTHSQTPPLPPTQTPPSRLKPNKDSFYPKAPPPGQDSEPRPPLGCNPSQ